MSNYILNNVLILDNGKCSNTETPELVVKCETSQLETLCNKMDIKIINNKCEDLHLLLRLSGPIPILEEVDIQAYYRFTIKPSSKNKVRVLEIEEIEHTNQFEETEKEETFLKENKDSCGDIEKGPSEISDFYASEEDFPEPDYFDKKLMKKELLEKIEFHVNNHKVILKQLKDMAKEISNKDFVDIKTLNTIDNNLNELFEKNNILHYK